MSGMIYCSCDKQKPGVGRSARCIYEACNTAHLAPPVKAESLDDSPRGTYKSL